MPFEIMDPRGVSASSDFFHDICFPAERQVGFWKQNIMPDHHGIDGMVRAPGFSPLEKLLSLEAQSVDYLKVQQSLVARDQKAKPQFGREERTAKLSKTSCKFMEQNSSTVSSVNVQPSSCLVDGNGADIGRIQHESSLFSSSLSEAYSRKLNLSANDFLFIQPDDTAVSDCEQDKSIESLKEIEAQTIGNLLPDEEDLFSGVIDELGFMTDPIGCDNLDDFDIFCSGGGMELDADNFSCSIQRSSDSFKGISGGERSLNGLIVNEHPYGELPSRTLFVRNINSNIEEYELKLIFEQYGDIRIIYTACKHRGFVMISYYDIRAAQNAMRTLQNKPLRSRKLDIRYSIPKDNPLEKEINQGTLVVFNLDYLISNDDIRRIFGVHGQIKEIREIPHKHHHKFVEFYDVRAAEAALRALSMFCVTKKQINLEGLPDSRQCVHSVMQCSQELAQDESSDGDSPDKNSSSKCMARLGEGVVKSNCMKIGSSQEPHSTIHVQEFMENRFSQGNFSAPNTFPSPVRVACASNQYAIDESGHYQNQMNFGLAGTIGTQIAERIENRHIHELGSSGHPRELSGGGFGSLGKKSFPLHGHPYGLNNSSSYQYHPSSPMKWQNFPSLTNAVQAHHQPQLPGYPKTPVNMMNAASTLPNYQIESSRAVSPPIWDRRIAYTHEAPGFHLGSLMSAGFPCISNSLENASQNIFSHVGGNCTELSANAGMCSPQQMYHIFSGRNLLPVMSVPTSSESPIERARFRRKDFNSNHVDRKQFELDIHRILHGDDCRTTLMLKNIPNKYTSKMLLASIDEHHQGTYDFIYLPIDFKNKCNVGYAFINMIDPLQIVPFHKTFNGKKWEKFNSEKVASLAYARIQGKTALVTHFQNSSLMNEDKRCRPILFHTNGPNAGDQESFPVGTNIRSRCGKPHAFGSEEKYQGNPSTSANGEESSNETDSSSGSAKD